MIKETLDEISLIIRTNQGALINLVGMAASPKATQDFDDLLSVAMDTTRATAQRYHPFYGRGGFIMYNISAIKTEIRRAIQKRRLVWVPEKKMALINKYKAWCSSHLVEMEYMDLSERMKAAGITQVDEAEMVEIFNAVHDTAPVSLNALTDPENSDKQAIGAADAMLTDRGAGADQIRDTASDPRIVLLRPAFERLSPLHQGLLASLYPCSVTDDGEVTFARDVISRGNDVLDRMVRRLRTGIAPSAVATRIESRF